jgi:2-polyprenyl-3-methyl-5-hydroxy-6-metoxy-1,4-benzoquinol methylase
MMATLESLPVTPSALVPRAVGASPCHLCGSVEIAVLANRGRRGKPLRTVICLQCGLVWLDPLPHNPREFYAHLYRIHYKGTYVPRPKHILRAGKLALSRYQTIRQWLATPQVILDVGSGGGEFLYLLQKLGHCVRGIEPNQGYARYAIEEYGLQIDVGFVQDVPLAEEQFDLITMWHVLEHTEKPGEVLTKLCSMLKEKGMLIIEVPNIEATCQAPQNTFHEAHIFNFNLLTLQKLTEKVGLTKIGHVVSIDGGNITLFVQKDWQNRPTFPTLVIPGNAEKIIRIVKGRTILKHYMTTTPYRRLLRRFWQYLEEQYGTRCFLSGRLLLDRLYAYYLSNWGQEKPLKAFPTHLGCSE